MSRFNRQTLVYMLRRYAVVVLLAGGLSACGGTGDKDQEPPPSSSPSDPVSSAPVSSSNPVSSAASSSSSTDYVVPANNFAVNGGVEDGTTNWGARGDAIIERSTAQSYDGNASLFVSNRADSWHGATFDVGYLTVGFEYEVAVWVRLAAGEAPETVKLTGKVVDDADPDTHLEYTEIASGEANANGWVLLTGNYIPESDFDVFIVETFDGAVDVSFYVDNMSVAGEREDRPEPPVIVPPTGEKFVGNITTRGQVRSDFAQYWNQITPENEGKWESVEGTRDNYNWGPLDRIYDYAREHEIPVKAHTLVWGSQAPNWIHNLNASEQAAEIEEWIRDYCERYPDTAMIDVVNEAHPNHAPADYARNAFGDDWIIKSFELARQYCPNAILIYNDFNFLTWDTDEIIELITPAVNAGVVDALGVQAHSLNEPKVWSGAELEAKLNQISGLGLPIYVSEYDIALEDDGEQLAMFQEHFPVMYEHPNVVGVTLWGYVVGTTWREGSGLIHQDGRHRPAMDWLLNYLGY